MSEERLIERRLRAALAIINQPNALADLDAILAENRSLTEENERERARAEELQRDLRYIRAQQRDDFRRASEAEQRAARGGPYEDGWCTKCGQPFAASLEQVARQALSPIDPPLAQQGEPK
jgi:hypothetical protein